MNKKGIFTYVAIIIVVIISSILVVFYLRKDKIEYQNKTYELRYDELGMMLFDGTAGNFSIKEAYTNKGQDTLVLRMYKFQGKRTLWVELVNKKMVDIDTVKIDFSELKKIAPIDIKIN